MSGAPGGFEQADFRKQLRQKMKAARDSARQTAPAAQIPATDAVTERLKQELRRAHGDDADTAAPESVATGAVPVGQGEHSVVDGDCISSIANEAGFFWKTLWDDPQNADLKQVRKDPNVLLPGDRVTIPEKRRKDESIAAEMRHRFKRKGEPAKLRLRLLEGRAYVDEDDADTWADRPRPNVPYRLTVGKDCFEGASDVDGWVIVSIPGNARRGRLILNPETPDESAIDVQLGRLSPIASLQGVKERLANLGFHCGDVESEMSNGRLEDALRVFQRQNELPETGEADAATRARLVQVHGS